MENTREKKAKGIKRDCAPAFGIMCKTGVYTSENTMATDARQSPQVYTSRRVSIPLAQPEILSHSNFSPLTVLSSMLRNKWKEPLKTLFTPQMPSVPDLFTFLGGGLKGEVADVRYMLCLIFKY